MKKFSNVALAVCFAGIPCFAGSAAEVKVLAQDPNTTSRTVNYHDSDIVPISTEVRFTTLIELPKEESILEVTCGDKEYWPVNWTGNLAYVKPAKPASKTNINLITASGNVYSFLATEVSQNPDGARGSEGLRYPIRYKRRRGDERQAALHQRRFGRDLSEAGGRGPGEARRSTNGRPAAAR